MFVALTRFYSVAVGGMSRPPKPVVQIKKVAPPAVPDTQGFRHSGSSFGSAGYSSAGEDHVFHDHSRGKSPSKLHRTSVNKLLSKPSLPLLIQS